MPDSHALPHERRRVEVVGPYNAARTLGLLSAGGNQTVARDAQRHWWTGRSPDGPFTAVAIPGATSVTVEAWGLGAAWVAHHAPRMVGATDPAFVPPAHSHPAVHNAFNARSGWRMGATLQPFVAMIISILGQRVTGGEAVRSYRMMVSKLSPERAPHPPNGPALLLPPSASVLRDTPTWLLHPMGIERKRAHAIVTAARHAEFIERMAFDDRVDARIEWQRLEGISVWTSAEVARLALGDPDAVSVGDFHLCHAVGYALAGEVRSTDARTLELLEPYRPHRGRVAEALIGSGYAAPRFGPRYRPLPIASW